MPSYFPPKKNAEYIFYVSLVSQVDTKLMQANPTIAAGDFQVSKDGGALANLTTLPAVTPASSSMVKITLSATEMNADNVTVVASDAAGAEWADLTVNIQTSARQIDDLAYPTTTGRSIDVAATGEVGVDLGNVTGTLGNANVGWVDVSNRVDVGSWLGTAAGTPNTAGYPVVTVKDGTGAGEIALTGGAIDNVSTVATLTGHTAQTGDSYARLGAPAGASVSADIAAIPTSNPVLLQSTTITGLFSQGTWNLSAGSSDDDAYNGAIAVITDQTTGTQKAMAVIDNYVGATKTVTLLNDPGIFTMANGDQVDIIADLSVKPIVTNRNIDLDANGRVDVTQIEGADATTQIQSSCDAAITAASLATSAALATAQADIDAILLDTSELQTDWADGGRLDLILDASSFTTQMTESYAADGVAPTPAQSLFLIQQHITEFAIAGTTYTTKKLDGSTTAATFTLDSSTSPTSITRAT